VGGPEQAGPPSPCGCPTTAPVARFGADRVVAKAERWAVKDDLAMIKQLSGTPSRDGA
jgi:hypothetical protein